MREVGFQETEPYWKRPERIVLAVTRKPEGGGNIIALGWKMRTSFRPPMLAVSIGKTRYSHELALREREFVLAVPGGSVAQDVLFCGTHTGRSVDKFARTRFTPLPASVVGAPLIAECIVNFECKVQGTLETGDHTIFAGEVIACWLADRPEKLLLSIGEGGAYKPLVKGVRHTLGTIP